MTTRQVVRIGCCLLFAWLLGCATSDEKAPGPNQKSAAILAFELSPEAVQEGARTLIVWETARASEFRLLAGGAELPVEPSAYQQGSLEFVGREDLTLRLEIVGEDGVEVVKERSLRVLPRSTPTIVTFAAEPETIGAGQSTLLSWVVEGARSLELFDGAGAALDLQGQGPSQGEIRLWPDETATYRLVAKRGGGAVEATLTVSVVAAPTLLATADRSEIEAGDPLQLSWQATAVTKLTIHAGEELLWDDMESAGTLEVHPLRSLRYRIEAFGPGGSAVEELPILVRPKIERLEAAHPEEVREGMEAELSWAAVGASRILLSNGSGATLELVGEEAAAGAVPMVIGQGGVFTLSAFGVDSCSERSVIVPSVERPVILGFEVLGGPFTAGRGLLAPAILRWDVVGARSLALRAAPGGPVPLLHLRPDRDELLWGLEGAMSFELLAENPKGTTTRRVEIVVVPPPHIERFEALPPRVGALEAATIHWQTVDAVRIELRRDGALLEGAGAAALSGSIEEVLARESVYELRAFNDLGYEVSQTIEVSVGSPVIERFAADRIKLQIQAPLRFEWRNLGGSSLRLEGPGGELLHETSDPRAIREGSFATTAPASAGTASYTLLVENGGGVEERRLQVEAIEGPMIERFEVDVERISASEHLTFRWLVTDDAFGVTPSLTLRDQFGTSYDLVGADPLEGERRLLISEPGEYVFTLEASTGPGRSSVATAAARVLPLPRLLVWRSTPTYIEREGEQVLLEWESAGTTSLRLFALRGDGRALAEPFHEAGAAELGAGTVRFLPTIAAPNVRAVLENELGTKVEADLRIGVAPASIIRFEALQPSIAKGQATTLRWETVRTEQVLLEPSDWIETDEAFLDIAGAPTARRLAIPDGNAEVALLEFPDGFIFPFDQAPRPSVLVGNAGFLSFDLSAKGNINLISFPDQRNASVHLSPFRADVHRGAGRAELWYELRDEGGERHLVIQWREFALNKDRAASLDFEVVLWPDGSFDYRYGAMRSPSDQGLADGIAASIGYQNAAGTKGATISRGAALPGGLSNRTFHIPARSPLSIRMEPVTAPFIDLSTSLDANDLTRGDGFFSSQILNFPGGFSFPFAGSRRSAARVMRDGYLHFELSDSASRPPSRLASGSAVGGGAPRAVHLAPYWTSLNLSAHRGGIWSALRDDAKGRALVIQWKDVARQDTAHPDSRLNFEILLREDGSFEYRYGVMDGGSLPANGDGSFAAIGYQEPNGVRGIGFSFLEAIPGGLSGRGWNFTANPALPTSGEVEVRPRGTLHYTLEARNPHSTHRETISVEVEVNPSSGESHIEQGATRSRVLKRSPNDPTEIRRRLGSRLGWSEPRGDPRGSSQLSEPPQFEGRRAPCLGAWLSPPIEAMMFGHRPLTLESDAGRRAAPCGDIGPRPALPLKRK